MTVTPTIWRGQTSIATGSTVASFSNGRFAIVGASGDNLVGRTFDIFGNLSGGDFLAALSGGTANALFNPRLATTANGDVALTYGYQFSATDADVYGLRVTSSGTTSGSFGIATSGLNEYPEDLATTSGDGTATAYTLISPPPVGQPLDDADVYISVRDSAGGNINTFRAHAASTDLQDNADISVLSNGNIMVVWRHFVVSSLTSTLRMAVFDSVGNVVATERTIGATPNAAFATVTALANGNAVVAWQDVTDQKMYYRVVDSAGADVTVLRSISDGFGILPKVVGLPDGGFVMAWSSYVGTETDGTPDGDVAVQLFDASGNLVGSQFRIDLPGDQTFSDLSVTPDGRIVVVYNTETGDSTDIHHDAFMIIDPRESLISGDAGNNVIAGRLDASHINGLAGDDILYGMGADDTLDGGDGNDILNGGAGADTLIGGKQNDVYYVDNAGDIVFEAAGQGNDTVAASASYALAAGVQVETLRTNSNGGVGAINLTGNTLNQDITGNAGANVLHDGGVGAADTLRGLGGNDTYRVFNAGDVIVETSTQGTYDVVMSAVDYALTAGAYVERLATNGTAGTSGIDLTGNDLGQEVVGNSGINILNGKGGNDIVKGLDGNDTLTGGTGADTFVFNSTLSASSNVDRITDYNVAADTIQLDNGYFTALTTLGTLAASAFRANTTGLAGDANDRIIYETDTGELYYDSNGTGAGGSVLFAKLAIGLALANVDFVVI